jgi:hypothetical protein
MNVRQSALTTWKTIVSNSPRTLLQIMPVLVKQLIEKLALPSDMLRAVAGSSLGIIIIIINIIITITQITTIITITQITIIIFTILIITQIISYHYQQHDHNQYQYLYI